LDGNGRKLLGPEHSKGKVVEKVGKKKEDHHDNRKDKRTGMKVGAVAVRSPLRWKKREEAPSKGRLGLGRIRLGHGKGIYMQCDGKRAKRARV